MPASGQEFMCGPLSVEYITMVFSVMPSSSSRPSRSPIRSSWSSIVSWYFDCQRPARPMLSGLGWVRKCMWVLLNQTKNGSLCVVLAADEIGRGVAELLVAGFHPLLGQQPCVLYALGAVGVGPGVQNPARAELLPERRVFRIVG